MSRGRNRRSRKEDTHDGGSGQPARHPARLTDLTTAGQPLHAPVCAGMEDARAGAKPRLSHRDLRRRSRDPGPEGQSRRGLAATARDHGKAEAHGQRGEDTHLQGAGRRVRLLGLHVRANVFGENRTAAMLVLEPIFEADLPPEQYAYRPGRSAQQAVVDVEALVFRDHPELVDADLADYFGSIPHAELLKSAARRIVDRRVLHLIKMWLECPVEETDGRGRKTRTTEARDNRRGIPQGSPISPLLANLYMRRFVLGWKMLGLERSLGSRIVTYADDLVILCRKGKAEQALQRLREIMGKLKLTVNEEKTRICKVPEGEFDFLGY